MKKEDFLKNCIKLIEAYNSGDMGQTKMPEDSHPDSFENPELRIAFFSLPMALNYQRDSYKLWEAAKNTFDDEETKEVFDITKITDMSNEDLRNKLTKHKLALQPNKHINTWRTISKTIHENFGSFTNLFKKADYDFLVLKEVIQKTHKKGFPYLSGPKIFHYWSFILGEYAGVDLSNREFIEIAPDTHVTKGSLRLGVIEENEADKISKEEISERWRKLLENSKINPIDMHPPLWFWSRNNFQYVLK